jgi:aquaporin Z
VEGRAVSQLAAPASAAAVAASPAAQRTRWRDHAPEYLMEAAGLGLFMVSACGFGALLEHPASALRGALPDPFVRRLLMGCAMGATAIALIYSPWGRRSGAHLNPAVTLAFLRLGMVRRRDAAWYVAAQFAGAVAGVQLAALFLRPWIADPAVRWVVTRPGPHGAWIAFAAEVGMTFVLMSVVLEVSSRARWARWTGACAGLLVALYIAFEAPVSGMSLNPARTFGSALAAGDWTAWWAYVMAPLFGMQFAATLRLHAQRRIACAKLHHENRYRCIFCETRMAASIEAVSYAARFPTRPVC